MSHNERCKECKVRVRELLEKCYGPVITNYRIPISTKPEDFCKHPCYPILNEIFALLQKHRGFTEFVRASYVDVDFFLPEQGMLVEFDESQHFTEPRKIALAHYPSYLNIGFSRESWMKHCDEIQAHDNDPPFRDEQRAWYDTVRDFLPEIKGFQPTMRLYSRGMEWCTLDPGKREDVEKFKSCISDAQKDPFSIEVLCDSNPELARIIISGSWEGNPNRAKSLLEEVAKKWPPVKHVNFLITPGAFIRFPWPDDFPQPGDNLFPCQESVEALRHVAQKYCHALIDEKMRKQLAEHADYLTIGVDSRDCEKNNRYEVEFVALVDLKTNQYFWTGKSYPDTPQEHRLIRIADLSTHFVNLSMGKVMVLGCHDLKLFSNRGRTVARNEWRKNTHKEIDRLLEREQPVIVLQHPHTTDRSGSWISEWNELVYSFPTIKQYISAGLYYHWGDPCRSTLGDVLKNTKRGSSIDFIVFSDSSVPIEIPISAQDIQKREKRSIIFRQITDVHASQITNFSAVVTSFEKKIDLVSDLKRTMNRKNQCRYSIAAWPKIDGKPTKSIYYEFDGWAEVGKPEISVEIQFWVDSFAEIGEIIQQKKEKIIVKMPGKPNVLWDKKSHKDWYRLKFIFPDTTDPEIVAQSMQVLVKETKDTVNDWLKSKNMEHY